MAEVQNKIKRLEYDEVRDKILAGEMDVNIQYPGISDFDPPILEIAIYKNDTELIDYLLQHNVDVNRHVRFGNQAIYVAVISDDLELTEKLLNAGAVCPPVRERYGQMFNASRLLQVSIYRRNKEMIKLISKRLDEYLDPNDKLRAFQFVTDYNEPELTFAMDPNSSLLAVIEQNNIELFKKMISKNPGDTQDLLVDLLISAVVNNRYEFVEYLIDNGAQSDESLLNALRAAIGNQNIPIIELLIRKGADVNASPMNVPKLLNYAFEKKNIEIIEKLIAAGADVPEKFNINDSLHIAVIQSNYEKIENLIKDGADINDTSFFNKTPLTIAVEENIKPAVELLLKKGAKIERSAMVAAADKNNLELLKVLMEADVYINDDFTIYDIMRQAINTDKYEMVEYLISRGANVNGVDGEPGPLELATSVRNQELIKLFIKNGADVKYEPRRWGSALDTACELDDIELVKILAEAGANVNISLNESSSIQSAINHDNYELAEYLVNHCISANITCDYSAALICAIYKKNKKIVELLIKNNVEVNCMPINSPSALSLSIQNCTSEITEILMKAGADMNMNLRNNTPLIEAIKLPDYKMTQYLIENGADVDVSINNVGSLLNLGFRRCGPAVISLALDVGADVNVVNENCETAIDVFSSTQNSQTLIEHVIKLKAANLYLIDKNLDAVKGDQFEDFYSKCLGEVESMKTQWYVDKISFYDILHSCANEISRNIKDISKDDIIFDKNSLCSKFKLYGGIIYYRVLKATQYKE